MQQRGVEKTLSQLIKSQNHMHLNAFGDEARFLALLLFLEHICAWQISCARLFFFIAFIWLELLLMTLPKYRMIAWENY